MSHALALVQFPVPSASGSIEAYISAANRVPLLTEEEEKSLARRFRDTEDLEAARRLVMSHLRLVIAVARGYLGYGLPSNLPSLGELSSQAKSNLQAPWLGITAFFTFAIMLSLLVFIFEGVRDAFDPRKTFR